MSEKRSPRYMIIEHPDGRRYGVTAHSFEKLYRAKGFSPVGYEDGGAYEVTAGAGSDNSDTTDFAADPSPGGANTDTEGDDSTADTEAEHSQ